MSVLVEGFLSPGTKQTARKKMKCPHLVDVYKAGFHRNSWLFIFGLRFCSLNCIKPAMIIPPVRFCIVAVHIIFIERY